MKERVEKDREERGKVGRGKWGVNMGKERVGRGCDGCWEKRKNWGMENGTRIRPEERMEKTRKNEWKGGRECGMLEGGSGENVGGMKNWVEFVNGKRGGNCSGMGRKKKMEEMKRKKKW